MSQVIVDFQTLKYNLYEILGIESDASENKIKKAFRNLIINFHPDKNNQNEEDIYYHIVTANQILSNSELRQKYDDFLTKRENNHNDLKDIFNKIKNDITTVSTEKEAKQSFHNINKILDAKHLGNYEDKTIKNFNELLKERENEVNIQFEDIKTSSDFNSKFEDRINTGYFNDQIISTNENMGLLFNGDNYSNLDVAFNNLYLDGDNVSTSKFTSLDSAFKIQKLEKVADKNIKEAINRYNSETNNFSAENIKFTKEKFETWH